MVSVTHPNSLCDFEVEAVTEPLCTSPKLTV